MVKSQYPHNPPSSESSKLQAEAILGRGSKPPGPVMPPEYDDTHRASKRQADAWAARDTHSRPIMPPKPGQIEVDDADVRRPEDDLHAEYVQAKQRGDEVRAAQLHAAIGIKKGLSSRVLVRGRKWVHAKEDDHED
jgi:hypothetical protein